MKKNIDFWKDVLANMPESYHIWFGEEKKYLQQNITLNSKVLDIGCGDGRSIFDIISITENVIGIDYDEKAVLDAKQKFVKYPSVKFFKADAINLPFNDGEFDFVICMGTFANFGDNKFFVLNEMKRILKSSGKIIISVFSDEAFEERMKVYKMTKSKIKEIHEGKVIFDEEMEDEVSEQFSQEQLYGIFSKVGLIIEDMTKVNIAYLCTLSKKNIT